MVFLTKFFNLIFIITKQTCAIAHISVKILLLINSSNSLYCIAFCLHIYQLTEMRFFCHSETHSLSMNNVNMIISVLSIHVQTSVLISLRYQQEDYMYFFI